MESSSFWTDIKKFEDTLAKDPSSYCFAPLAELYRKSGLLDDAISIALKGTAVHPEYVGGHMALGRAYLGKGMKSEALESLLHVISFTPENMLAHKLLCQIYSESGDNILLKKSLETLLILNPADTESRILLESIERLSAAQGPIELNAPEIRIELPPLEDAADGMQEFDLLDEIEETPSFFPDVPAQEPAAAAAFPEEVESDGSIDTTPDIRTATMAELYAAQGHKRQAVEIYRQLLAGEPWNQEYGKRITELEMTFEPGGSIEPAPSVWSWGSADEPVGGFTEEGGIDINDLPVTEPVLPQQDDSQVARLESWLSDIRRVQECRSGRD